MNEKRASMEYVNDCVIALIECGFGHPDELMKELAADAFLHGAACKYYKEAKEN